MTKLNVVMVILISSQRFARITMEHERILKASISNPPAYLYGANIAHTRQSRPDFGLGFQVKVLVKLFPLYSEAVVTNALRVSRWGHK